MSTRTLTDLPTEIRQIIFSHAIPIAPPESPGAAQPRVRLVPESAIWIPRDPAPNPALPLLLTCRAFQKDVLDLQFRWPDPYRLDIMLVRGCGIWPTWVSPPPPRTNHMRALHVEFRIFDPEDQLFRRRFEMAGSYGVLSEIGTDLLTPCRENWEFYYVLNVILWRGAAGLSPRSSWPAGAPQIPMTCSYTIGTLTLDVTPPPRPLEVFRPGSHAFVAVARGQLPRLFTPPTVGAGRDTTFPYVVLDHYVFPGPQSHSELGTWDGPTRLDLLYRLADYDDKLAMWLANALWALLRFQLCVVFWQGMDLAGLVLYEGILDAVEVRVGGVLRRTYGMDELFEGITSPDKMAWKEWAREWRRKRREGVPAEGPRVPVEAAGYIYGSPDLVGVTQQTLMGTRY